MQGSQHRSVQGASPREVHELLPQPRQGELLPQPAPNKDEGAGVLDYEWTREKAAARQLPPLAVHTTASAAPECSAASRTSGVSRHHPTTVASSLPLRRASLTSAAAALQHAPYLCPQQQQQQPQTSQTPRAPQLQPPCFGL